MSIKVLLVEDDELLAKRIISHFAETEFRIEVDSTGATALAQVQQATQVQERFALAIVDIVRWFSVSKRAQHAN